MTGLRANLPIRWMALGLVLTCASCRKDQEPSSAFVRLMNRGKAYLENRDGKSAVTVLTEAVAMNGDSVEARRNLARAYLLLRQSEKARESLLQADRLQPDSPATSYLIGLTHARKSQFQQAVPYFEKAVRLDPYTATLRFQLATAYEATGNKEPALQQLHETVRLDPLHASAHFKLGALARQRGDQETFRAEFQEFARLKKRFGDETRSAQSLEQCIYTRGEPVPITDSAARENPAPVLNVRFSDATTRWFPREQDRSAQALCFLEADAKGIYTFLLVRPDGQIALMTASHDGAMKMTPTNLHLEQHGFTQCLAGDFHNDVPQGVKYDPKKHAMNDCLLVGTDGLRLLKRTGPTSFEDVTHHAGLSGLTARSARWVDVEHDGDLDLLLATQHGLALWQNNGNATFENVTEQVGLTQSSPAVDVLGIDLERNVAVDIVSAGGPSPTLVFENQRAGRFRKMAEPPGPWPAANRLLADDLNNDGKPDVLLVADHRVLCLYTGSTQSSQIQWGNARVTLATLLDYDNDGWLDLLLVGQPVNDPTKSRMLLYRNMGHRWESVTRATGLDTIRFPPVGDVVPGDLDGDADTDLLFVTEKGLRVLQNDGGSANGQLKVHLTTIKTNPTGLGAHLEVRSGIFWAARDPTGGPIEIGLAGNHKLDSVQVVWTNGVVDNRIDVTPSAEPLSLVEKNVATGSCPFLYAWNGRRFRFVTDLLGNAPIGLPLSRGVLLPADPDEIVEIGPARLFQPRDRAFELVVTDEFREVLYLDSAGLIAVDHPPDVEVHSTDKLMPSPFPPSELWALGDRRTLKHAASSDVIERTDALRSLDGVFARPGRPLPPPYRGMCQPLSVSLDFGPLDVTRPFVLAMTGWLQYGDGSTNIAMSQDRSLTIVPPTLTVETGDGQWHPVDVVVGMPAGKTKTVLTDLTGKLPPNARLLRLTTTFEIRWDRIALFERKALPPARVHEWKPGGASLAFRGFSEIKQRDAGHPTTPDYENVSRLPSWETTLQGWCTRYGDVLELVSERDDRLVLINGGDALTLRFPAGFLPPVPHGLKRTFFFHSVGWEKDGDHNVIGGDVVGPLPPWDGLSSPSSNRLESRFRTQIDDPDWPIRYNTRWVPRNQFQRPHP